jgi:DtxR family Mn-dependent transcriptional regulator
MTQDKQTDLTQYTEAVENFLKTVFQLKQQLDADEERVSTNALSQALNIKAPSVTDMAQRLQEQGLLDYRKYRGVLLTEQGEHVALQLIRRHRLIELYLVQELGYELHQVHDEAENLEHAVSDLFVEAINRKLNNPDFDPHGDPIPTAEGELPRRNLQPLSLLPLATLARVSRFIAKDNDMLQHTLKRGFHLGSTVAVTARDPFNGPLTVRVGGDETVIGHTIASAILVEIVEE